MESIIIALKKILFSFFIKLKNFNKTSENNNYIEIIEKEEQSDKNEKLHKKEENTKMEKNNDLAISDNKKKGS